MLFKLSNNEIKCPELASKLVTYESQNPIRMPKLLYVEKSSKLPYSTINRICFLANINKNWIRFKEITPYQFDKALRKNTIILSLKIKKIDLFLFLCLKYICILELSN